MKIIGIDPGTVRIGYGVIKKEKSKIKYVESGLLKIPISKKENRLIALEKSLNKLLTRVEPDLAAVEKLYFVKNQKTALEVAQARGIIIASIIKKNIPLVELSPSQIKAAATGNGRADKKAVAKMVQISLNLPPLKGVEDDITDALAAAIAVS